VDGDFTIRGVIGIFKSQMGIGVHLKLLTRAFGCSVMLDDVMASAHENYFPWLSALELIPSLVVDCITWDPLPPPVISEEKVVEWKARHSWDPRRRGRCGQLLPSKFRLDIGRSKLCLGVLALAGGVGGCGPVGIGYFRHGSP
jgi:hypothetical protein